jgi:hypothetical protein
MRPCAEPPVALAVNLLPGVLRELGGGGWLRVRCEDEAMRPALDIDLVVVVVGGGGVLLRPLLALTAAVVPTARRHSRPVWLERMTTVLPAVIAAPGLLGLMSVKSSGRLVPVPPGLV